MAYDKYFHVIQSQKFGNVGYANSPASGDLGAVHVGEFTQHHVGELTPGKTGAQFTRVLAAMPRLLNLLFLLGFHSSEVH